MNEPILEDISQKEIAAPKKKWIKNKYVRRITQGMIVTLPIIIVLFLISLLFKLILKILSPISALLYPGSAEPGWIVHFLSFIVLIAFFYFIGRLLSSEVGTYYLSKFENEYLAKIPLYTSIRDLVQQFAGIQEMPFSKVVLVDPFDSGVLMTGFITEDCSNDIYTVFVPTAPNPTNGNIYHVPASRLQFVKVSTDVAMRTVVGMGTGSSALFKDPKWGVVSRSNLMKKVSADPPVHHEIDGSLSAPGDEK